MYRSLKIFDAKAFFVTFADDTDGDQIGLVVHIPHLEPEIGGRVAVIALDKASQAQGGQGKHFKLLEPAMEVEFKKRIGVYKEPPQPAPIPQKQG